MTSPSAVAVGDKVGPRRHTIGQAQVLRYAGASRDFNPLHWDPDFAAGVSPTGGVIVHGMLNVGLLAQLVAEWAGDPARLRRLDTSFRAPCPVGATVTYGGEVIAVDAEAGTATLAVWAELPDGEKVIDRRRSRAVVDLD